MNDKKYWFRRKRYGYGLTPATWQGWLLLAIFIVLFILNMYRINAGSNSAIDNAWPEFIQMNALLTIIFVAIAYWKGEKPLRWRWGEKDEEDKSQS